MPSLVDIDWSKVSIQGGQTRDDIIKQYEKAIDELRRMDSEFNRYFGNKMKKAGTQMLTHNIFREVNDRRLRSSAHSRE